MSVALAVRPAPLEFARDLVDLGKPRVTALVVFTTAIGLWLAPESLTPVAAVGFLAATALLVASANTLNCWWERDSDALMVRTRQRPLPSGRLAPRIALGTGLAQGAVALATLGALTNPVTVALGAAALFTYVAVYTPLKRVTPWSLHLGAVPGAIPPLMGWTAAQGSLGTPGVFAFALLLAWQLPHFLSIALYLEDDYARGGMRVLSVAWGEQAARRHLFGYTLALVSVSLAAWPLGVAGPWYSAAAAVLGARFVAIAGRGLTGTGGGAWARRVFLYSIAYLALLITALLLDAR